LKGFKRVFVGKGGSTEVTIPLKASDLTYWDINKKAFVLEHGKLKLFLGSSSVDPGPKGEITVIPQ
jgi:beta-glucosidase